MNTRTKEETMNQRTLSLTLLATTIALGCVTPARAQELKAPMNAALTSALVTPAEDDATLTTEAGAGKTPRAARPLNQPDSLSRWNVFVGNSGWYPMTDVRGNTLDSIPAGIIGSLTYFKDRNLGFEIEGNINPQSQNDGTKGAAIGPVYRFMKPFQPTLHGLIGSQYLLGPIESVSATGTYFANAPVWATTLTVGLSGDVLVPHTHNHLALRVRADYQYMHATYGPVNNYQGGQVNLNIFRFNPGLVVRFGDARGGAYSKAARKAKH